MHRFRESLILADALRRSRLWSWMTPVLWAAGAASAGAATAPLGAGSAWRLEPLPGVRVSFHRTAAGGIGRLAVRKSGGERRMIALANGFRAPAFTGREVVVRLSARLDAGLAARPAVLFFEPSGGVWVRVGAEPIRNGRQRVGIPLRGLRPAAFSHDDNGKPDWNAIRRVWLGFVIDGAGKAEFELHRAELSNQPYRPTRPAPLLAGRKVTWRIGHDPAVTATAHAKPPLLLRVQFHFPGGRHMYMVPSAPVSARDLGAYAGVRITYRAQLPAGIPGLLFMLAEGNGAQYFAAPAPPPSATWRTVVIPFSEFKLGTWTHDPNGKFDPDQVRSVCVGAHGTAAGNGGDGWIEVRTLEAVPAIPGRGEKSR